MYSEGDFLDAHVVSTLMRQLPEADVVRWVDSFSAADVLPAWAFQPGFRADAGAVPRLDQGAVGGDDHQVDPDLAGRASFAEHERGSESAIVYISSTLGPWQQKLQLSASAV